MRIDKSYDSIPFELVYWADIMYPAPLDHTITDKDNPLFIHDPYRKGTGVIIKNKFSLKAKIFQYINEQLDKIVLNKDLSINYEGVTDHFIAKYFSDLHIYFANTPSLNNPLNTVRNDIQSRLFDILLKYQGYDILLVAHSMGSIVAFDVLTKLSKQLNINTLVTIGSPLGIPVIVGKEFAEQRKNKPRLRKLKVPSCIRFNWFNLSDAEDNVALDHTLNNDFATSTRGIKILDIEVFNDYEINNKRHPHKSYGYLRTLEFAKIIDQFLTQKYGFKTFLRWIFQSFRMRIASFVEFFKG